MCSLHGNGLFLSAICKASARRMQFEQRGGWIDSLFLVDLADGIYHGLVWAHVFGMAYDNCTTPTAARRSISEGSDGVIVTIPTEGLDADGAGPPWWRAEVDAHWAEPGGGGVGRIGPAATGGGFHVWSTRTLACAAEALAIGVT
jgi:hypothetical protein